MIKFEKLKLKVDRSWILDRIDRSIVIRLVEIWFGRIVRKIKMEGVGEKAKNFEWG